MKRRQERRDAVYGESPKDEYLPSDETLNELQDTLEGDLVRCYFGIPPRSP